ncbi:MAG: CPBP family intramembrane glutamic endopeptidase [Jatrophihabitantaceae bacterium]
MTIFNPPPTWPEPPAGWTPPPGWQPDPNWPEPPPGWKFWIKPSPWRLDPAVANADSHRWTIKLGAAPILAVVAVLGLEYLTLRGWHPHGAVRDVAFGIGSILHYAAAVAMIVWLGRPLAAELGGWYQAFGLSWPRLKDAWLGAAGAFGEYLGRIVVSIMLLIAIPALRHGSASNVSLHGRPAAEIATLIVVAVLIAPPIEELIFRGLLLRTLMRRTSFWPAALISTTCFAVLHLYEVGGAASRILLFASIFVFGLGQCLLVRWTGRLATSTVAHAVTNAAGVLITLAAHR